MKSYFNRAEKNQVLTLTAFIEYATATADTWAKSDRYKEPVKALRMARSFIFRSLCLKCEKLDDLEQDNLKVESNKMSLILKYKNEAIREYKQMLELDSVTPIQTADLLTLCERSAMACIGCSKPPDTCEVRPLFIKYDIPVCDDDPGEGKCPYSN